MKKSIIFLIIFFLLLSTIGLFIYFKNTSKKEPQTSNYDASKTSQENKSNTTKADIDKAAQVPPKETEIAIYTTKIKDKSSGRQNNISIACSTLNDTLVEPGAIFSFCDTLGQPTPEKGYKKALIFKNGDKVQGLGGGKCQISSTLYNAVLQVKELEVVERHPHSGKVYYVPEGKDAAVSFGTYDFKFKNNTGKQIKIKASNTENEITIQLLLVE